MKQNMKRKLGDLGAILGIIMIICLFATIPFGWGLNIYKLTQCDFEAPYKPEVIRSIGVPVFFLGVIAGYCGIEDGPKK